MIKTLIHLFYSADILTEILGLIFLLYFIIINTIHTKNKEIKTKLFYILYLVPLMLSIIHLIIFTTGSAFLILSDIYKYFYIASILMALYPLLTKNKIIYKLRIILILLIALLIFSITLIGVKPTNFTRKNLTDSYISLCDFLEKNYILNDWKKIDYDKLKSDGLKLVKEAEETGDFDKYYVALENVIEALHDGHVSLSFYEETNYFIKKLEKYNDYGLSLITLDDGTTIAVNVEDDLEIKNGTVITKWNNIPISEAKEKVRLLANESVNDNEEILKTMFLSTTGGDTVEVTYMNSENIEETITLNQRNTKVPRAIKTMNMFNQTIQDNSYEYKMLDNNIGYLKLDKEEISDISDSIGYLTGNHSFAREKFRKDLNSLKEDGMTKLIIDLRNNNGGFDEVATALTSLFTKDKMYAYSLGIKKNNKNQKLVDRYVVGDGEFSDIEVLVLTNMQCGSAGDGLVLYLSRLNNVKIAGLSFPSGINQETGGSIFLPKGAIINYPTGLVLDENNNPNIDVDYTRTSRTPLDLKIPLDKESALKIFEGEDYELEWAVSYLK